MKAFKIRQDLYWTGVLDPDLKVFDIIMETKYGTSYNSYLLEGSEKTALFETAKEAFFEEMVGYIESVASVSQIDYLIMDHTEPDHAGSIKKLLDLNPHITIVATGTAIQFLKHIINTDFNSIAVSDGMTLSLGDKTLEFMVLPNLHWPDTMYTYVQETKTLFTCDSFGSHFAAPGILRSSVTDEEGYADATKYYFDCIIGPFAYPYMYNALERIKDLEIENICCGHGPVLDSHFDQIFGWYREWCQAPAKKDKKLVVMPYVSAYGYTKQLSEAIAKGVEDAGAEVHRYDLVFDDKTALPADMASADGYLFGTPTILGEALEPVYNLTLGMYPPVFKGRLASAFGSYGWSGEGVPHIIERLKQIRLRVLDGFKVRFKPDSNQLSDAYDFGYNFGCVLLKKEQKKQSAKGARTLVKCLVCGAIFDSSLEECPVCGVGPENFVPAGDAGSEYSRDTDQKYLILGGGIAGLEAARAIRERDKTGSISILSEERHLPYNRPMLTKALLSEFGENQMAVEQPAWFEENAVSFVSGVSVESIDPAQKIVKAGGKVYIYDKLIYALGAHCFVPPFKGHDLDKVVSIRTIEDAEKIKNMLPNIKTAAVIGGGVLGLEAAWSLRRAKLEVTVIEGAPALMARQLNPSASAMMKTLAEDCGVKVYTAASTAEINEEGVVLSDGTVIPAELVIVSTGVRGNLGHAQEAGLEIGRSIKVNDHMETNLPDVYAAGDCAEYNGINYALWSQSVEQGKTAGANAAGDDLAYETVDGALAFNGMNTSLFAIGDNGSDSSKLYKTVETTDLRRRHYEKYTFDKNRLVGVILIGDTSRLAELTMKVKEHAKFSDVIKL
ncbi:MAG: FAD-dependent oxidoreductase [Lachnospiraceae bacterium]|nr:FAD-dependent oxidoreductase [Lachnospiraceae bacterium]